MPLSEALEEALCFGWIDGLVKADWLRLAPLGSPAADAHRWVVSFKSLAS